MTAMSRTLLITGGAGFIGSNLVRVVLDAEPETRVITFDRLAPEANRRALAELENHDRHELVVGDVRDAAAVDKQVARCDAVLHLAAESHVDRSIDDAGPFVTTNVNGTQVLLDAVRRHERRMVHVSTDEVYGHLPLDQPELKFTEESPLEPRSPYAASKAGSDLLARAAHVTHGVNVVITRCSNNFGPWQFPETVLDKGEAGRVYNIGADNECSNRELTETILDCFGAGPERIDHVTDRLAHDLRYAIDTSRIETELGWQPTESDWPEALKETVQWYRSHPDWWTKPA